jgi:hypothetical protein
MTFLSTQWATSSESMLANATSFREGKLLIQYVFPSGSLLKLQARYASFWADLL